MEITKPGVYGVSIVGAFEEGGVGSRRDEFGLSHVAWATESVPATTFGADYSTQVQASGASSYEVASGPVGLFINPIGLVDWVVLEDDSVFIARANNVNGAQDRAFAVTVTGNVYTNEEGDTVYLNADGSEFYGF